MSFYTKLTDLLKTNLNFVDDEGELLLAAVQDRAWKLDHDLIRLLLSDDEMKEKFFDVVAGSLLFKTNTFIEYISQKNFLDNSYTRFRNRIGLTIDGKYLSERGEVSLAWAYKDCVLEGGQTKEEEKRKEIFFNEVLAQDEINRLVDPKVFTKFTRYSAAGAQPVKEFNRDENGILRDNLIVKGNNLIALNSLIDQFRGRVKLIYIDPPYNLKGDSFGYNDSFNHSTWLTFMRNRLKIAHELLHSEGAIFVQIDLHELGYLTVLMDEIFNIENKVQIIAVKTASPAGFKTVNPGPIDVTEYILFYTKDRKSYNFIRNYVPSDYDENYNLYIQNIEDSPSEWRLIPLRDVIYEQNGIVVGKSIAESNKNAKAKWGDYWKTIRYQIMAKFALDNAERVVSIRDPHKPSNRLKTALADSSANKGFVYVYQKNNQDEELDEDDRKESYLYNGGALSFYSNKVRELEGQKTSTILLTDFWDDLRWDGIAKEGGVKLKNGKKPEKLIKRILEMTTRNGEIVMDFFLGSGTTAAVAHKMGRQYIGIEQLDYGENDSVARLTNVIHGDKSGISKSINWLGGGAFIHCELLKYNQSFVDRIQEANNSEHLLHIWQDMAENSFLNWYVNPKVPEDAINDFIEIGNEENGLVKQKKLLMELLDKNQLYVNLSEIDDAKFNVSDEDKRLNKAFYGEI